MESNSVDGNVFHTMQKLAKTQVQYKQMPSVIRSSVDFNTRLGSQAQGEVLRLSAY
jgi:hypothetical protein